MAANRHTTSANAVTLVWGSLRRAPITRVGSKIMKMRARHTLQIRTPSCQAPLREATNLVVRVLGNLVMNRHQRVRSTSRKKKTSKHGCSMIVSSQY